MKVLPKQVGDKVGITGAGYGTRPLTGVITKVTRTQYTVDCSDGSTRRFMRTGFCKQYGSTSYYTRFLREYSEDFQKDVDELALRWQLDRALHNLDTKRLTCEQMETLLAAIPRLPQ